MKYFPENLMALVENQSHFAQHLISRACVYKNEQLSVGF